MRTLPLLFVLLVAPPAADAGETLRFSFSASPKEPARAGKALRK